MPLLFNLGKVYSATNLSSSLVWNHVIQADWIADPATLDYLLICLNYINTRLSSNLHAEDFVYINLNVGNYHQA